MLGKNLIVICTECSYKHTLADNGWSSFSCLGCGHDMPNDPERVGVKFDHDKLPYDLIAPELLEATADVLKFGATKYGPRNWERGMLWSRPFGALMRHMWAWWRGESIDEETGKSHLHHAACCLMFLIAYEERKIGEDDRP